MDFAIKPSDVVHQLMNSPWRNSERETVATNILKMSRFHTNDRWTPFTWADYVSFCSHIPSREEQRILDEFALTGYLKKEGEVYYFQEQIINVYIKYTR